MHRSRVCHFVIDVPDLDDGASFWSAALGTTDEPMYEASAPIYRELRLPDSDIRILLQKTDEKRVSKERMHLDLETDDTPNSSPSESRGIHEPTRRAVQR